MPCDAIAMTTAQLRGDRRLITDPAYRDALLTTIRNVTGQTVEAYQYSGLLYVQAGPVQITIDDAGAATVQIYRSDVADRALIARITAALDALQLLLAQTRAAQAIAARLPINRTQVDARGNITLEVTL